VAFAILALTAAPALADDWNVTRLRGDVLQLVDGSWQPLTRGGVVPDDRVLRTMPNGRLSLVRGEETIELGPNTQIRIFDEHGNKPFTTVHQHFGTVSIEAEVQNVQHFAVETAYLAAVVKGTRFTVRAGKSGSDVSVERGHVAVEDSIDHSTTLIAAGQQAKVRKGASMKVSGKGKLPVIVQKGGMSPTDKVAQATSAVEHAVADLEQARASGDEDAIKEAEKALKDAEKAAKEQAKADADAVKAAQKAAEEAAKDQAKAEADAAKAAAKATEDARKAAEKAAKDALKDDKKKGPKDH
jgi:hypothetical protein